jgi:hypothetical protein
MVDDLEYLEACKGNTTVDIDRQQPAVAMLSRWWITSKTLSSAMSLSSVVPIEGKELCWRFLNGDYFGIA